MPRVLAITSEKGGVGKSTLALHLAAALTERGLHVAVIDEDARVGSSLRWAARAAAHGTPFPFAVLPADDVRPRRLAALDAVLIDTEGRPKRKALRELAAHADLVLVPSGPGALELDSARDLLEYLERDAGAARRARAVLTRVPTAGRTGEEAREDLREAGFSVCNTLVHHCAAYGRAAEQGALVSKVRGPRAKAAWNELLSLSRELL
ncbi:division plane positioning ATPase MipZ [Deinococcus hohokamensis]|uniref:Division plane positioning ATPase MipZ n=1 Tax=Deinococcus hohokamensis TaxID=309883 RepID=A0ABV9I3U0_9DEIO